MARQPKEKEVEIGKVFRRNAELEECAALLSAEAQAQQARAREEEFVAAMLQAQLQAAAGDDDVNNRTIHTYMGRIRGIIEPF